MTSVADYKMEKYLLEKYQLHNVLKYYPKEFIFRLNQRNLKRTVQYFMTWRLRVDKCGV